MLNEPDETTEMVLQSGAEISRMLEHRNKALATIRAARAQAEQALDHACAALGGKDLLLRRETFGYLGYKSHDRSLEEYRAQLDRSLWLRVFDVTKLASLMGSKQRSKFYKDLDAQVPEFNEVNLRATFEHVHLTGAAIFKQTVRDLFEQLRPRFKSHKGFGFGERLIFESALEWGVSSLFYEDILLDLMAVCAVIERKPRPAREDGILGLLSTHLRRSRDGRPIPGETRDDYFRVRWFKKGSLHVWFLREDLRRELNAILEETQPDGLCAR